MDELQGRLHDLTREDTAKALAGSSLERALAQKTALLDQAPPLASPLWGLVPTWACRG